MLKPEYRDREDARPYTGHCYVATQVYYHLAGGKEAGWKPMRGTHEGGKHWWLENVHDGRRVDLTREQFETPVPYEEIGRGGGFLTGDKPDARARIVIERVRLLQAT